ncbi:maleylpyruvate isomerase N-terminal domain-containing protein [Streptomyces sp. TLI_105]|uniref:maleylpyruvate isomerase N-terminal domain-containing protein n=1 Tax=Streptomyces sp. TLI_105 TaxID=1881019 RepID=UPI00089AFF96|nr:maleylpyruvate isomerase N-terminal domain-containing protein [Streptomyces sp. TLI_105]SED84812.1 TIGR03083 family protein [Streptomyces sp. TLI_105]
MSDALLSALAESLAELVTAVETSDDEVLDPDTAVKWLESTGHTLRALGPADRRALDGLFRETALRRPPGPWREELLKVSEGFGLTEDAHAETCEAALDHARRFAATVRDADPATPVPTCPGWTLADLTRHLGTVHHWAEHLVRTRPAARVLAHDVPLDLPADPAAYADRLAAAAERFAATAREADPDAPVWSPGADPHVRHYPRHVLFETLVHLADAELAVAGTTGPLDPGTAADALDHFLGNAPYVPWIAEPLAHLDRDGAVLRLGARDTGTVWTLVLGGGGFTWSRESQESRANRESRGSGAAEPTASVEADTGELLLLLHRRYDADDPRFSHSGDRDLLDDWLAATAL